VSDDGLSLAATARHFGVARGPFSLRVEAGDIPSRVVGHMGEGVRRFYPERPRVAVARVEKRLIDAVFLERGEREVVVTSLGAAAEQLEIVQAA